MPLESINFNSSKKSDFQPTQDELNTIHEKMKDPEFMKLMVEYMATLEDPATRKEEEEYLEQVEREAKEGGDDSFDFVFPKANYFVELMQGVGKDREGSRVFINMCTSEKIEEYTEQTTNSRDASNWIVPVSIGRPRPDTFEGKPCCVYDAAFHPKTIALGDRSDRFMTFLVEIAVENINAGHKKAYGYGYRRMSGSTSTVIAVGIPQNMTVKRAKGDGKGAFNAAKEQSVLTAPTKFGKDGSHTLSEEKKTATSTAAASSSAAAGGGNSGYTPAGAASATTVTSSARQASSPAHVDPVAAASSAPTPVAATASSDNLPPYTITHRGVVDLVDTWNWKVSDKRTGVPKQLVVTATFEGVTSAAALEMDVSADGATIDIHKTAKHAFYGSIVLPFTVEETPSSAKFDKRKGVLTLVLDVKNTTIPLADLPKTSSASDAPGTTEDAEASSAETKKEVAAGKPEAAKPTAIDVKSALPSMSPTRADLPIPAAADDEKKTEDSVVAAPVVVEVEEKAAADKDEKEIAKPAPAVAVESAAPVPATTTTPSAAEGFESDANDRMAEVMRKIAEAKRQREEAEREERAAEEAVREAEEAEAKRAAEEKAAKEAAEKASALEAEEVQRKESASKEEAPAAAADNEDPVEVIDLRNRQAEWLKGVNGGASSSTADASADSANPSGDAKQGKSVSFGEAITAAVKSATGGLLDDFDDDYDEEAELKKKEMRRKLREVQRQEEAAKEAERLDTLMKEKMAALPLRSRYIFEIE